MPISIQKLKDRYPDIFYESDMTHLSVNAIVRSIVIEDFEPQTDSFEEVDVRLWHCAIGKLAALGDIDIAAELAENLLPRAQSKHLFFIVLELCDILIFYNLITENLQLTESYEALYQKTKVSIDLDHEGMLLAHKSFRQDEKVGASSRPPTTPLTQKLIKSMDQHSSRAAYYRFRFLYVGLDKNETDNWSEKVSQYFATKSSTNGFYHSYFSDKIKELKSRK